MPLSVFAEEVPTGLGAAEAPLAPLPPARRPGAALWVAIALALALHGGLLAVALVGDKVPDFSREEQAIPVEIVHEIPKPPETPRLYWPEPPKDIAKPEVKPEKKAEPPKEQPKEAPKEPAKQEAPKQEESKQEQSKPAEPAKAEPPKPAPPKAEPLKQQAPPQEAPKEQPKEAPKEQANPTAQQPPQQQPQQQPPQPQAAAAPGNAPADAQAQAGSIGGANARGNGQTPEALRAAYLEPPRPPLTRKDEVYLPLKSELVPQAFRDRALTGDGQREVDDYKAQVFGLLEAAKPPTADTLPGQVIVGFTIDLDGNLLSVSVVRSSGDPALEAQALDTVRRAAPFPLPPPQSPRVFAAAILFTAQ